jgi:uncharacterized spore protein YtfJ
VNYDTGQIGLSLFDLEKDAAETTDVKDQHPDVVEKIQALAGQTRKDLGDSATKQPAVGAREVGRVKE